MLKLNRKAGQELVIGDSVRVKIVAVRGQRVRLGIEAPAEVHVHRSEMQGTEVKPGTSHRLTKLGANPEESRGSQ